MNSTLSYFKAHATDSQFFSLDVCPQRSAKILKYEILRIKLHILNLKPAPPLHAWFRAGSTARPAVRTTGTVPRPSPSPSLPVRSTRGRFSSSSKLALKIQRLEAVGDAALARRAEPVSHVCTSALLASHSSARYQLRAPAVMRAGECGGSVRGSR